MSKHNLKPLSEVMTDLRNQGYKADFNYRDGELHNDSNQKTYAPEEITIKEEYRFEGESDPADSSILYAIETSAEEKGLLVDAYGADTTMELEEYLEKVNREDAVSH